MQKFRSWRITRVVKQRRKRKIWVPNPKQVRNHKNAFWKVDSAPSRFNAWKIRRVALVRGKFKFLEIKSSSCILTKRLRKYAKHRYAEYYRKGVTSLQAYWRFMRYRQHRFNRHFFINFQKYKKIKLRKRRKMRHLRFTGVKNRRKTRALQKKYFLNYYKKLSSRFGLTSKVTQVQDRLRKKISLLQAKKVSWSQRKEDKN